MADYCYKCGDIATSREHVPPKCLFPESAPNKNSFRKNLITVPSCDLHNSKKSKDDEFLMVSLAGVIGNNPTGHSQKMGKVNRAINRSKNRLLDNVFSERKHYLLKDDDNGYVEVIYGMPDHDRLRKCFEHIVFGIYFHHFSKIFIGDTRIYLAYLTPATEYSKEFRNFIRQKSEMEFANKKAFGENKDVFSYQFSNEDESGIIGLKMCFYGGLDVYVALQPEGRIIPRNIITSALLDGIETHIHLEDKKYIFNGSG